MSPSRSVVTALPAFGWARPALVAAVLLLAACADEEGELQQPPRTVLSYTVQQVADSSRPFSGTLRAVDRTDLSFERAGPIKAIHFELGDQVEEGELLAELDDRPFMLDLDSRRAELRSAVATRDEARLDLERHLRLVETGAVSQAQVDRVQARADSAEAQVEALRAAVEGAEETLDDTRIVAPYSGEIAARLAEPGEVASAGRPVLRLIGEDGPLEATVTVPAATRDGISTRSPATVVHPAHEQPVDAIITEIGREANAVGMFPVTVELQQSGKALRPGESVEVRLRRESVEPLLAIPLTAFVPLENRMGRVFLIRGDEPSSGTLEALEIEVVTLESEVARVRGDLGPGDRIAARGVEFLRDGQQVQVAGGARERYNF